MRYIENAWVTAEKALAERGIPRTRENIICIAYVDIPDTRDDEAEIEVVPPDLRILPAPDVPLPTWN